MTWIQEKKRNFSLQKGKASPNLARDFGFVISLPHKKEFQEGRGIEFNKVIREVKENKKRG